MPCVGSRGEKRISVHQARLLLFRPDPVSKKGTQATDKIEVVGDPTVQGFVVYGIRHKERCQFGYVGQTGNFARRIRSHTLAAHRGSKTKAVIRWMHSVLSGGETLEIVLLDKCTTEEQSLSVETEWVRKLAMRGHNLTNRWIVHQEAIASRLGDE